MSRCEAPGRRPGLPLTWADHRLFLLVNDPEVTPPLPAARSRRSELGGGGELAHPRSDSDSVQGQRRRSGKQRQRSGGRPTVPADRRMLPAGCCRCSRIAARCPPPLLGDREVVEHWPTLAADSDSVQGQRRRSGNSVSARGGRPTLPADRPNAGPLGAAAVHGSPRCPPPSLGAREVVVEHWPTLAATATAFQGQRRRFSEQCQRSGGRPRCPLIAECCPLGAALFTDRCRCPPTLLGDRRWWSTGPPRSDSDSVQGQRRRSANSVSARVAGRRCPLIAECCPLGAAAVHGSLPLPATVAR